MIYEEEFFNPLGQEEEAPEKPVGEPEEEAEEEEETE